MRYHEQTKLHTEAVDGNCWATCLACILDLEKIPELNVRDTDWWAQSQKVAADNGCVLLEMQFESPMRIVPWAAKVRCILSGPSPRQREGSSEVIHHAVVGTLEVGEGEGDNEIRCNIEHDPHPSQCGITKVEYITLILKKTL